MIELLIILSAISFIIVFFLVGFAIVENEKNHGTYGSLVLIVFGLICYFIVSGMTNPENYTINKNIISCDSLEIGKTYYTLKFPKDMKIEITDFDMDFSESFDYKIYRIYLDDKNYIEIENSKFDSLDYQLGEHNF